MTYLLIITLAPSPIPSHILNTLYHIILLGEDEVLRHAQDTSKAVHKVPFITLWKSFLSHSRSYHSGTHFFLRLVLHSNHSGTHSFSVLFFVLIILELISFSVCFFVLIIQELISFCLVLIISSFVFYIHLCKCALLKATPGNEMHVTQTNSKQTFLI